VVVGFDRLRRNAVEVMTTTRELGERGVVLRSLREGIDNSNATGRMVLAGLPLLLRDTCSSLSWKYDVNMHGSLHGTGPEFVVGIGSDAVAQRGKE
jgi:resolvase-like protein